MGCPGVLLIYFEGDWVIRSFGRFIRPEGVRGLNPLSYFSLFLSISFSFVAYQDGIAVVERFVVAEARAAPDPGTSDCQEVVARAGGLQQLWSAIPRIAKER